MVYVDAWDECEVQTRPYLVKVWRRKGQPLRVPEAGEDHKFVVFGAVDYATGQVLWQISPRKGETAFTAFLDHLAQTLPANELLVLVSTTWAITRVMHCVRSGDASPTGWSPSSCRRTRRTSI